MTTLTHEEICQVIGTRLNELCQQFSVEGSCARTVSPDGQEVSTCFEIRDKFGHSHLQIEIHDKADIAICEYVYHRETKSARFSNLKRAESSVVNNILQIIEQVTLFKL